ncbi:Uma2 family endonuclease [Thermosynechococcaceae cyanobacterium BACA0444]|uniref:Uma2 family endonuclease n=1 Tax=Pseudocalidococcus azoricus BACA0444 TaxID=2918990 RepID=A0AAE4FTY8_9CYAN|nr:Uma2 family endonuclease [Pseudocalidococcus azoricus]MDS3861197.1 Uma2 family endonuclease [Pseudocalidococcus azoricus BACA0444]
MTTLELSTAPSFSPALFLPGEDELPADDNQTMETQRHKMQMDLLIEGLDTWLEPRADGYVGGNMFIYFSQAQIKSQDFKGPDFFAVTDVPKRERKSWVIWEEEKAPDVVIELLSPSTADEDKTTKKAVYQTKLRVPEFYWYDPFNPDDFAGFSLISGHYQPMELSPQGWLSSESLGLVLRPWPGIYRGVEAVWLRWATLEGEILPTGWERAAQESQRAELLAAKLKELGVDPDLI